MSTLRPSLPGAVGVSDPVRHTLDVEAAPGGRATTQRHPARLPSAATSPTGEAGPSTAAPWETLTTASLGDEQHHHHTTSSTTTQQHVHHRTANGAAAVAGGMPSVLPLKTPSAAARRGSDTLLGTAALLGVAVLWGSYSPTLRYLLTMPRPPRCHGPQGMQCRLYVCMYRGGGPGGGSIRSNRHCHWGPAFVTLSHPTTTTRLQSPTHITCPSTANATSPPPVNTTTPHAHTRLACPPPPRPPSHTPLTPHICTHTTPPPTTTATPTT